MITRTIACILLLLNVCIFARPTAIGSIGLRAGAVSPSIANISAFSAGFCGEINPNASPVFFQPYFDYWAAQWRDDNAGRRLHLFSAGVSVLRKIHIENVKPMLFLGGGIGVNANIFSAPPVNGKQAAGRNSPDIDLSLHGLAGFLFPLNENLSAVMQLKYVAAGRIDYAGLWLGVNYRIKTR